MVLLRVTCREKTIKDDSEHAVPRALHRRFVRRAAAGRADAAAATHHLEGHHFWRLVPKHVFHSDIMVILGFRESSQLVISVSESRPMLSDNEMDSSRIFLGMRGTVGG